MHYARNKYGTTLHLVISPFNVCYLMFSSEKDQCLRRPSTQLKFCLSDAIYLVSGYWRWYSGVAFSSSDQ